MAAGGERGPIRRSAVPKLRIVGDDDLAEGNPTATRLVRPTAPEEPADLPEDGKPVWRLLVDELDRAGLVASVDGPALHLAVRAYLHAIEASNELLSQGPLSTGSQGQLVAHPAGQAFRSNLQSFTDLAKQLGLTFAARARIVVPEADGGDAGNPFAAASNS